METAASSRAEQLGAALPTGVFTTGQAELLGKTLGITGGTLQRTLADLEEGGIIKKTARGRFAKLAIESSNQPQPQGDEVVEEKAA
jgi:hypothetical protein